MKLLRRQSLRALGLALLCSSVSAIPVHAQAAAPPLQAQAEEILKKVGGDWGVVAWQVNGRKPLIEINAHEVRIPASNNKVFTSIWAMDVLGADYRFPTDLLVTGPIEGGVLRGNVVLRGSGDPAFGYPQFTKDPMEPLRIMAQQLRARGVTRVEGGVIGDPFVFDTVLTGPKWPRDTGGGSAEYAPGVSGLAFQRNLIWIEASPRPGGGPAVIELSPPVGAVIPVKSTVRTGGGNAWAVRQPDSDTIEVKGGVSGRYAHIYRVGVTEPALMAAGALRQALIEQGIQVQGGAAIGHTPEGAKLVHRHLSIPLSTMVAKMNTESDNFFAEHLWKAAAAKVLGQGSYARGGVASALHFMRRAGVPAGQLYQFDGSGLSEYDRVSPNAMVHALVYANGAPFSEAFHRSLAVAGDPKGTLRRLFRGSAAENNLHAKTGYINDVRTLSGYVRDRNGRLIAFSFLYNGRGTSAARGVQTELGELLANYPNAPAAAKKTDDRSTEKPAARSRSTRSR
jgi:D-alanyl-D-alanine carboxypeptidase/D-alanyl-D-alanine-endopeptidase (penicillin-binding protein 4)